MIDAGLKAIMGSWLCEASPRHIHQFQEKHLLPPPVRPGVGVFGQQQRMEGAGRTSGLYRICLHHMAFKRKNSPAFFNIYLAPNCVLTFLQWGERPGARRAFITSQFPDSWGDTKIF